MHQMRSLALSLLAATCLTAGLTRGEEKLPKQKLLAEESTRHVPPDSLFFLQVRVADLFATELGRQLVELTLGTDAKGELVELGNGLAVPARDFESLVYFILPLPPEVTEPSAKGKTVEDLAESMNAAQFSPQLLVTRKEAIDRVKFVRSLTPKDKESSSLFLSDRTIAIGTVGGLFLYTVLQEREKAPAPLAIPLEFARKKHHAVVGWHMPDFLKKVARLGFPITATNNSVTIASMLKDFGIAADERLAVDAATVFPLLSLCSGALAMDVKDELKITLHLEGPNPRTTALALQSCKTLLALSDAVLADLGKNTSKESHVLQGLGRIRKGLRAARLEQRDNIGEVHLSLAIDPALLRGLQAQNPRWRPVRRLSEKSSQRK
jgi:hypothetical protein